jgi:hypothetical protein
MSETAPLSTASQALPRRRMGLLRFSAVELLIAIVLLFVATPFLEDLPGGDLIEAVLMSFVLLAAVLAIGGRRRMLFWAIVLVLPAVLGKWVNHLHPNAFSQVLFLAAGFVFIAFVVVNLLRFVLRTPRVNAEVLCASVAAYLLLGLAWSFAYLLVAKLHPAAFAFNTPPPSSQSLDGMTAFYFSFVTLSTVGYGDISPVSSVARMLAVLESMTGTLYVAVLIARLVALYSTPDTSAAPKESEPS